MQRAAIARPASALTTLDARRRTLTLDGRAASWLELGPDRPEPVVVLHGGGLDRAGASWGRSMQRLAVRHRVIAPDLPGHGGSEPLAGTHRVEDVGRWLLRFLEAAGVDRAALTGVSLGGAAALWIALEAPERVAAVVPVASYGLAARAPMHPLVFAGTRLPLNTLARSLIAGSDFVARQVATALVHDPRSVTGAIVAEIRDIAAEGGSARAFDRFLADEIERSGLRTCLLDRLPSLAPPALFIHGVHDRAVPVEAARVAARAARAPLVELEAGHWPMYEAPDAMHAALDPFLERHLRSG